ncbi:olfactory receptor 5G3-like [Xenopus tropicalis]|uniref:Olfactory receptor n=1 Tax=Xenopus tropicalis TaxID=8364 RepID=A0A8J1IQ02_XENTR|nr:olfactory receptor 5G3-like [Xenopus tropicalis]
MEDLNQTSSNRFILIGLTNIPYLQAIYVSLFFIIYITTLAGNSLLIIVVRINEQLQTPMYLLLSNLSILDICLSSNIAPRIMINTLSQDRSISLFDCALQMFFHLAVGGTECLILAVMAYDRYAAICQPLHYNTVMNKTFCICMAAGSWILSFISAFLHVYFTFQLPYCRSHNVNHYFCEMPSFFRLSCRDTWPNDLANFITAGIIAMCSFLLTLISYIHIILTILKIRSNEGRQKSFSTCTSHLTVVSLFYGTILFIYMIPNSANSSIGKTVSIINSSVITMLNPIIYSVRNKDVKGTIRKQMKKTEIF